MERERRASGEVVSSLKVVERLYPRRARRTLETDARSVHEGIQKGQKKSRINRLVVLAGIEPATHGFSVRCSTN